MSKPSTYTAAEILAVPMEPNDAGAKTIREYLVAVVERVWAEKEGFSGKRPFGNSGWESEIERALVRAGMAEGKFVKEGDGAGAWESCEDVDEEGVDRLVRIAIKGLRS